MKALERSLAKLTIRAYLDRELKREIGHIQAMYNPEALELNYEADYQENQALNDSSQVNYFTGLRPGRLSLQLLFDSQLPGNTQPVDTQLTVLRALCGIVDGRSQETRFLQVKWGKLSWHGDGYFAGRMASMSVSYTLFDRDGAPLRANVTLVLKEDRSIVLQQSAQGRLTPTPSVVQVQGQDTLPLIASSALSAQSSTVDYLDLAYTNDLDNLGAITPGQTLVWPTSGGGAA